MPSTIVTTIGDATANSYISVEDADTYFDDRLNVTAWTGASDDDKARALLTASGLMDRLPWFGVKATDTQALAWPRVGVPNRDAQPYGNYYHASHYYRAYANYYYASDSIPQQVINAQCEIALLLLQGFEGGGGEAGDISKFSADGFSVEFFASRPAGSLPPAVSRHLAGLVEGARKVRA